MAKFEFTVKNTISKTYPIEAETAEEAQEKFDAIVDGRYFVNSYRWSGKLGDNYKMSCKQIKPAKVKTVQTPKFKGHNGKSMIQKFCEWHASLVPGTEYTNDDIRIAIGAETDRAVYTLKFAQPVRDILLRDQITWKAVGSTPIGQKILYRKGKVAA